MTTPSEALEQARQHAEQAWYLFAREIGSRAKVPEWRTGTTDDGQPTLTAEVVGPGKGNALRLFTSRSHFALVGPGQQRPAFDYSTEGRIACVWRTHGVWVVMWHPDTPIVPELTPAPAPVVETPIRRMVGGRFPFTRRKKETTTA
ncbi:hypothetical protein [Streptomyces sp. NPDC093269]|uniref:hypothetical protein n=1 Tax=Streptomyces sp. NPDC093269 TaxID=3366038 RepID=UPI003828B447